MSSLYACAVVLFLIGTVIIFTTITGFREFARGEVKLWHPLAGAVIGLAMFVVGAVILP